MTLLELAQATIDARAAAVVAVTQSNAADVAAKTALDFATEAKANADTLHAAFLGARAALIAAFDEPLV